MKIFANIVSYIFNPLLMIIFLPFFLVYKTTHDIMNAMGWMIYSAFFLLTLAIVVFIEVKRGIFINMDVSKQEQRPILFIICFVFGILYLSSLFVLNAPYLLILVTLGIIVGIILLSFINKRVKASIHVAAITAITLSVSVGYGGYFYLLLLLIPLVAWSRLELKRHSFAEVVTGNLLGVFLSSSVYTTYELVKPFFKQ